MSSALYGLGWALSRRIIEQPVFVVGAGRSGTKALRQALQAHPAVINADGESPFIAQASLLIEPFQTWPNREYLRRQLKISPDRLHHHLRLLSFEAAMGPYFGARRLAREALKHNNPPWRWKRWCAKTFPDEAEARCLTTIFPAARFVYLVRNGYDVVNSRTHWPGMKHLTFQNHCEAWAGAVERLGHLDGHPSAITIRHEDFVAGPESTIGRLLEWLGLPLDERPAHFARTTVVHSLDQRQDAEGDPRAMLAARPPSYESWTEEERTTFRKVCGHAMEISGYAVPF